MKFEIVRHVTIEQIFVVEAAHVTEALSKSCDRSPDSEREIESETVAVRPPSPQESKHG